MLFIKKIIYLLVLAEIIFASYSQDSFAEMVSSSENQELIYQLVAGWDNGPLYIRRLKGDNIIVLWNHNANIDHYKINIRNMGTDTCLWDGDSKYINNNDYFYILILADLKIDTEKFGDFKVWLGMYDSEDKCIGEYLNYFAIALEPIK